MEVLIKPEPNRELLQKETELHQFKSIFQSKEQQLLEALMNDQSDRGILQSLDGILRNREDGGLLRSKDRRCRKRKSVFYCNEGCFR